MAALDACEMNDPFAIADAIERAFPRDHLLDLIVWYRTHIASDGVGRPINLLHVVLSQHEAEIFGWFPGGCGTIVAHLGYADIVKTLASTASLVHPDLREHRRDHLYASKIGPSEFVWGVHVHITPRYITPQLLSCPHPLQEISEDILGGWVSQQPPPPPPLPIMGAGGVWWETTDATISNGSC